VLFRRGSYQTGFALLLGPALATIAVILLARHFFPKPRDLEPATEGAPAAGISPAFWYYLTANACVGAGMADFALIGFHFQRTGSVEAGLIPVYYAAAMAAGAVGGLVFGKLLDRFGMGVVLAVVIVSTLFAPLVFLGGTWAALAGMVLWGIGMSSEGLIHALVAGVVPAGKRSSAFGLFDAGFGVAWFAGSCAMGILYEKSIPLLIAFSVVFQLVSLPIFLFGKRKAG
jgi:predicted MFS family arabinose efflux permease